MEPILPRPSKIRKRANKACLACRARKVRCDVSQRGRPCMNCFLDSESCVVVDRASRRRKSTDEYGNGDAVAENGSVTQPRRRNSVESGGEAPAGQAEAEADEDARMDVTSDGGSYEPETLPVATSGFSAVNSSSSFKRPAVQPTSPSRAPQDELRHQLHPSAATAKAKQLLWPGEQATLFGAEVTYSVYPFLEVSRLWGVLPQDVGYLEMQGCLRVPKKTILDEFVKQYFLHVHPIMPIIDEGGFWQTYGCPPMERSDPGRISLLIFQAMLFAACAHVPRTTVAALGFSDIKSTRAAFYRRAKLIFDFEAESSPIAIAQAALLLSSWSPPASHHFTQTSDFWLGIAIRQAKLAGAHRYEVLHDNEGVKPRYPTQLRRRKTLKRLWWCIIVSDKMVSLSAQRPTQVTTLHFKREDMRDQFTVAEFVDEIERSRVYNSGAKRTLVQIFIQMAELATVLTDLLAEVLPPDEGPQWDRSFSEEEQKRIQESKEKMAFWYDRASKGLRFPRRDSVENGSENERPPGSSAAGYAHESVLLFTNFICLIYQSAIVRLSHYECLRMVAQTRRADAAGPTLPEKTLLAQNQREIQHAAHGVIVSLRTLAQNRLTRWLPLNSLALVSLPLILSIIQVKLSPQPGPSSDALHYLYESVKAYQPQQDVTDWMADSVRRILDLSGLDRLDRAVAPSTRSEPHDSDLYRDVEGLHPSLYLRLTVSLVPDMEGGGFLRDRAPSADGLSQILSQSMVERVRTLFRGDAKARRRTPSAGFAVSASTAEDQALRQRIATWQAHDHALSSELGFDPSDLSVAEVEGADSPRPSLSEDVEGTTAWKDVACGAFSDDVDAREAGLLDAFVFQDQTFGAYSTSQVEWPRQERTPGLLDRDVHIISPEVAQDTILESARFRST